MEIEPPDPSVLLQGFLNIQREIFVNVCAYFSQNVHENNKNIFTRANDFSKDFNNCDIFDFEKGLNLNEENFPIFCNFVFDFMNYVRKIDASLYENSINFAKAQMSFPTMPTLENYVVGCGNSIAMYLDMRENGELPNLPNQEEF